MRCIILYRVLIVACFLVFVLDGRSQSKDPDRNKRLYLYISNDFTLHTHTQMRYGFGWGLRTSETLFQTAGRTIKFEAGYFILPRKLSLGIGYGWHRTMSFGTKSTSVTFTGRYFLSEERNSVFFFCDGGPLLKLGRFQDHGYTATIGAGKKFFYTNKLAALVSVGYNLKRYSFTDEPVGKSPFYLRIEGIEARFGFFF